MIRFSRVALRLRTYQLPLFSGSQYRSRYKIPCLQYNSIYIQPPVDGAPTLTTLDVLAKFAQEIGQAREYSQDGLQKTLAKRQKLMELLPGPDDVLPPRHMRHSFVTAIVPLKSKPEIRERYVTTDGKVRIGRLLEDMDVFAVYSCFNHVKNPKSEGHQNPYSIVTAMVDSIHIARDNIRSTEDVRLSGHVTYAGKSSMEVCMIVDQKDENGNYQKLFDAVFFMVARDPMNAGAARVNPLVAESPEEEEFMKEGKERQRIRKQEEEESVLRKPPNKEERDIIHTRFLEKIHNPSSKVLLPGRKYMKDSVLRNVLICQPQNRNRYNKIFGGFIMRQAYELALTNTWVFAKRRPKILYIDDIKFKLPVEIGSILRYRSHIGYVEANFVHTVVNAEVIIPHLGEARQTNEFHFTFLIPTQDDKNNDPIPELEFETYEEAIYFLHARRQFKKMLTEFSTAFEKYGNIGV